MHVISGVRDPAASFPLDTAVDDASERRQANRAIAVSAIGLALTGLIELAIALLSGSVALLGDALHNLSDVSTSALVFVGFRASRKVPTERYPYGYERAEDLAGIGVALVIWAALSSPASKASRSCSVMAALLTWAGASRRRSWASQAISWWPGTSC